MENKQELQNLNIAEVKLSYIQNYKFYKGCLGNVEKKEEKEKNEESGRG